ncbi:hypothetical protein KUCAC02_021129, partial [Chaenocephalus aceratus]
HSCRFPVHLSIERCTTSCQLRQTDRTRHTVSPSGRKGSIEEEETHPSQLALLFGSCLSEVHCNPLSAPLIRPTSAQTLLASLFLR